MFAELAKSRHLPPPLTPEDYLSIATKNNVTTVITIGTDAADSQAAVRFAEAHDNVYSTVGIHPSETTDLPNLHQIQELKNSPKVVAFGEIGLDYHYPDFDQKAQIRLFEEQLQLAQDLDLPVILHIREAYPDALAVLDNFPGLRGVAHSFSDHIKPVEELLKRDLYIGLNGIATFTRDPFQLEAFNAIPLDRLLLETDAPFLTPKPFRGKINHPAYVKNVGEWVAKSRGLTSDEIAKVTTKNASNLFNLPAEKGKL